MKNKPEFIRFFLKNGLEVILVRRPEHYTAALTGYFRAGSAYENQKVSGASHFVEHLLFRGNQKFKTPREVDEEKDRLGLFYEANTDYDRVRYHATFPPQEIEKVLEFSASILFESLLADSEIEKERQVMLEEEKLREDNFGIRSWDLTLKTRLKNKNHPLTLPREGLSKSIRIITPKLLKSFYEKHFAPSNLTLVIGSPLKLFKTQKNAEKMLEKFPQGQKISPLKFSVSDFSTFSIATETKDIEKVYFYFTFPAFSYNRPLKDRLAVILLSRILRRIRLEKRLYFEKGLSYDWGVGWSVPAHPIGFFWVYSSCDPKNLAEIITIFFEELKKLGKKSVPGEELERVRDYINKIQAMDFDDLSAAIDWFLDDFYFYKQFYSPEEIIKTRNTISADFLLKIAAEIINFKNLNITALGPIKQKDIETLAKKNL